MKKNFVTLLVWLIAVIPLVYLAVVYGSLPGTIALHFDIEGRADRFGDKGKLLVVTIVLTAVSVGIYYLLSNLYRIDPKKAAKLSKDTMHKIALGVVVLVTAIQIMIIYAALNNHFSVQKVMLPLLGLFFAYMGNLMYSVKPNYFVGIRTPWTLESPETWRKTHQLAGKLWFAGGIVIAIGTLLLQHKLGFYFLAAVATIITLIPVVYSYKYFQQEKHMQNG